MCFLVDVPFNSERTKLLVVCGNKPSVEHGFWCPRTADTRCNQVVTCRDLGIVGNSLDHHSKVVEVILLIVSLGPQSVSGSDISFSKAIG